MSGGFAVRADAREVRALVVILVGLVGKIVRGSLALALTAGRARVVTWWARAREEGAAGGRGWR